MTKIGKNNLTSLPDLSSDDLKDIITHAQKIKANPLEYADKLKQKTLLMIFEKPSLRTRLSFEAGMTQLGGHAIFYDLANSPMGKKESISDTAKAASRFVDIIMARLFKHEHITELAECSDVPVINALTDYTHPCQIAADLLTIYEKKQKLRGIKLAFVGDSMNNVTHSLLYGCSMVGMDVTVGCPESHSPLQEVLDKANEIGSDTGAKIKVTSDAAEATADADVVYTDSWMSYHIPKEEEKQRIDIFKPYQVNADLMKNAKEDAIFMNCLPAMRGYEQTADVIDGPQSIVFDQAENRIHAQKSIMLHLLGKF